MPFDTTTYRRCDSCYAFVIEGKMEAHERQHEAKPEPEGPTCPLCNSSELWVCTKVPRIQRVASWVRDGDKWCPEEWDSDDRIFYEAEEHDDADAYQCRDCDAILDSRFRVTRYSAFLELRKLLLSEPEDLMGEVTRILNASI